MDSKLKEYIRNELKRTSNPKYWKYIDEFIENISDHQIPYWNAWMRGKMSIY